MAHCLAGGTDLALNCDMIVTAEDATIGFPALRMGGTPPTNMWLYHVGAQWAKRLLFTGDTFTGRFAEKIGFALEAVPAAELDEHVLALATRIAAMGRDIVAINKHVLNRGIDLMGRAILQDILRADGRDRQPGAGNGRVPGPRAGDRPRRGLQGTRRAVPRRRAARRREGKHEHR